MILYGYPEISLCLFTLGFVAAPCPLKSHASPLHVIVVTASGNSVMCLFYVINHVCSYINVLNYVCVCAIRKSESSEK